MTLIEYHGYKIRQDNPADKTVVNQCEDNYKFFTFDSTSRVLDLGVYIGVFAKMAMMSGAAEYLGIEPDPSNLRVANENLLPFKNKNWSILDGVASTSNEETLTFYQTNSLQTHNCGTIAVDSRNMNRRPIRNVVNNHPIDKLIETFQPTHLKMDIEGAENDWFEKNDGVLPSCIEQFAVEVHRGPKIQRFARHAMPNILKDFELINCAPMIAFSAVSKKPVSVPELNISSTGTLMAVDLFFKRR